MDMNQYLDVFIEEAKEHLQAINEHLLEFEKDTANLDLVNEIFRSAHTLKGMAATMGFEDLASLTHEMENVLDLIRNNKLQVTTEIVDLLFQSVDSLETMVYSIIESGDGAADVSEIVAQLSSIVSGDFKSSAKPKEVKESPANEDKLAIHIDDFELTVINQSIESGYQAYLLTVNLSPSTVLKAARAYMVFDF